MLDRGDLASPLLVLARVHVRPAFEEGVLDVRNPGVAVLGSRERGRVGDAIMIVSIRRSASFWLILGVGVADGETFCITTLSSRRMSLAFSSSHLEVVADLVEGVLQVVEEEDVASRGPAD